MISLANLWPLAKNSSDFVHTRLFDEHSFYKQLRKDLESSKSEVIIESPFISSYRMRSFLPIFEKLVNRKVKVYVFTRYPADHDDLMRLQAEDAIQSLEMLGVQVVIMANNFHRKICIIDRNILWEGSLNILSQSSSKEIMRRISSPQEASLMFKFTKMDKFIY